MSRFKNDINNWEANKDRDMLKRDSSERGYKEIVRNCVDAMEAVVKKIGQQEDIKNATKMIVAEELGPKQIIKRGNNIFNLIHELYPDIRHGSTEYKDNYSIYDSIVSKALPFEHLNIEIYTC